VLVLHSPPSTKASARGHPALPPLEGPASPHGKWFEAQIVEVRPVSERVPGVGTGRRTDRSGTFSGNEDCTNELTFVQEVDELGALPEDIQAVRSAFAVQVAKRSLLRDSPPLEKP